MDTFLARQPIFDRKMNVFAYELLYRNNQDNKANLTDGDMATFSVIKNTLMSLDFQELIGGKRAFINFTKKLIEDKIPTVFSNEDIVVEILEDVQPDDFFIKKCKELKNEGYILALDDFDLTYKYQEVVNLVDIIKVDFMTTTEAQRYLLCNKYRNMPVKLLAEKVETHEEFQRALQMGFHYFQGYFFSKPIIIKGKTIQTFASNYLKIINELERPEPEINEISQIIELDPSLTYKLLRYINSSAFYKNNIITSVKNAVAYMGLKDIKKWISIAMIQDLGSDQPNELIRASLIRGRMCEVLADEFGLKKRRSEAFLLGILSLIDIMMNTTRALALEYMPLDEDLKAALLGESNAFKLMLDEIINYEQGNWEQMLGSGVERYKAFPQAYYSAVKWANEMLVVEELPTENEE